MIDVRSWMWSIRFMLRMRRRARREGIPYETLIAQQLELMRKETEALRDQTDHLRMANELRRIEHKIALERELAE